MTPFRTALTMDPQSADPRSIDKETFVLARRFWKAASETNLAAPEVFDSNIYPNPNQVAAYFDNPAPSSPTERHYEDECQKSDSLMAEAYCCSEILRLWQEQPVRAPRSCRMRLYAIEDDIQEPTETDLIPLNPPKNYPQHEEPESYPSQSKPFSYSDLDEPNTSPKPASKPIREKETVSDSVKTSPVKTSSLSGRIGKGIEAFFLTLLIFGLLVWLIPIARDRLSSPSDPTVDTESTTAESSKPVATPQTDETAPIWTPEAERLSLNGKPDQNRSSVLTIPAQNNDVFRR